ncbi:MAG TPA: hypothetical protein VEB43_13875 [Anaeromyxobacter sp.]|nr:hypothetical protein [Anaeromyxobacter sp.]
MSLKAVFASYAVALALPSLALAAGDTTRSVEVPEHGAFEIALPSAWRYSTESTPQGGAETLRLDPAKGNRFVLLATPAWVPAEKRDGKEAAMWMRVRLHGQTVEQDIPVEEYSGARNKVFWFKATNRSPGAGEHPMMVQGVAIVGELMVGFTLRYYPGDLPEREVVLKALGDAQHLQQAGTKTL